MENKKIGCALLILALSEKKNKRIKRKKWVKRWVTSRKQYSHVNILKEIHDSEPMDFKNYFRMSSDNYNYLLRLVTPLIKKEDTRMREAISVHERLALTLRFLATGRNFRDLSYSSVMGRSTVGEIVLETCKALNTALKDFIKVPTSESEWRNIALNFGKKWNFFHCLGSIDGKHVAIRKPANTGSMYYNYKHFFSIVLMGVVNSNYEFIMVDVGANGRVSDGGVMFYTKFWQRFLNGELNLPGPQPLPGVPDQTPYVFIADDAFPLSQNLMKPYSSQNLTKQQRIFNYRLSRARRVVENAFGILSARFGIFQKPMFLQPEKAAIVTLTCCYLHNFLIKHNKKEYATRSVMVYENLQTADVLRGNDFDNSHLVPLQATKVNASYQEAKNVRDAFCHYFNNEGEIPWQWDIVN